MNFKISLIEFLFNACLKHVWDSIKLKINWLSEVIQPKSKNVDLCFILEDMFSPEYVYLLILEQGAYYVFCKELIFNFYFFIEFFNQYGLTKYTGFRCKF